jgi:hypothetical protein
MEKRSSRCKVLAESVRHNIKEEEGEMLPKAKAVEMDFESQGQQMVERKKHLKRDGMPSDAAHAMVASAEGSVDAPAAAARTNHRVWERALSGRKRIKGRQCL